MMYGINNPLKDEQYLSELALLLLTSYYVLKYEEFEPMKDIQIRILEEFFRKGQLG